MKLKTNTNYNEVNSMSFKSESSLAGDFQKQIANAFNLFLNYKHYHWQTFGPFDRDLNIIFDEFSNEVHLAVEELAERVRNMGQNRIRIKEFRNNATVKPSKTDNNLQQMIKEADHNVLKVIGELNETARKVPGDDVDSSNILRKIIRMYEKHQWWLHYILNKRQGFSTVTH